MHRPKAFLGKWKKEEQKKLFAVVMCVIAISDAMASIFDNVHNTESRDNGWKIRALTLDLQNQKFYVVIRYNQIIVSIKASSIFFFFFSKICIHFIFILALLSSVIFSKATLLTFFVQIKISCQTISDDNLVKC